MPRLIAYFTLVGLLAGCPKRTVVRDASSFTVETLAALKRQEEAASALLLAAESANEAGDAESCRAYAEPALLIEASARAQAYRALWLAGLPYPAEDGTLPDRGTEQPDPGPAREPDPVTLICK
jgi:hypothetical protein